jgi:hypothetical protein
MTSGQEDVLYLGRRTPRVAGGLGSAPDGYFKPSLLFIEVDAFDDEIPDDV